MKVGITGATGYIGGALVPRLAEAGHDLFLLDNGSGPVHVEHDQWPVEKLDFSSGRGLDLLSDCEVILHFAAASGVMACAENPVGTSRVNVEGTRRLVTMCTANRIPLAFASSFAVIGHPGAETITEETKPRPIHEYGRQKAEGEQIVAQLSGAAAAASAIVRMSNVYGAYLNGNQRVDKSNVITMFLRQSAAGQILVNAPGTQCRNFVHIDDVVALWASVVRFLQENPTPSTHVFNCAGDESYSILQLAGIFNQVWREARPAAPALSVQVVPNPRGSVEILDSEFKVSRELTNRLLGLAVRRGVVPTIRELIESVPAVSPTR